mgnify:CR=1 FL=1
MAPERWIDAVVGVMSGIASHRGGKLRVYRVAGKAEIPEGLSEFPCAVIYPTRIKSAQYSLGGPCKELWEVRGEFYLFPDTKKSNLPELIRYFRKIRDATLKSMTLGGLVDHFVFSESPMELVSMTYETDGPERHGIVALWEVKEDVTGEISAGI